MISVYRLTFADGRQYVGQTIRPVAERLRQHRREKRFGAVGERLREGQICCVEVLAETEDHSEADTLEAQYIRWLPQWAKLNRSFRPRQRTPAPPVNGRYRCTWCSLDNPVELMAPNEARSRGCDSKCLECWRAYGRVKDYMRRHWDTPTDYSFAYRLARGLMAAGCWKATRIRNGGQLRQLLEAHRHKLEEMSSPGEVTAWALKTNLRIKLLGGEEIR